MSTLQVMCSHISNLANNYVVYLMYNPERTCGLEEGTKIIKTKQSFRKSFPKQTKQYVKTKIVFSHFQNYVFR